MAIVASNPSPVRATTRPLARWQEAMKSAIREPRELCQQLGLSGEFERAAIEATAGFPLFVPLGYLSRMAPGDPHDPLLRQVLPVRDELAESSGFGTDPVGDLGSLAQPGLLHKYEGRVLLITTGACAIHCRYCFRRHFPYSEQGASLDDWLPALDHLANDETIEEVILSGGDPLTLVDSQLQQLIDRLHQITHLRRLRLHSRLPIVIPERVTPELVQLLSGSRLTPIMVIHANHSRELDGSVAASIAELVDHGIPTLNQSVLLRGVNDRLDALVSLSKRLVELRVMPYYLHQLDRVAGAAHFEVPVEQGRELVRGMRSRLPGYAVPRYVQEFPGEPHKTVLQ